MDLHNKTALVTGGAHRVGRAITLALARAGANVVINYRGSADAAEETAREVVSLGARALPLQADISDRGQVEDMVQKAAEEFGGIDVLVNSASLWAKTPFPTDDFSLWHKVIDILVFGSTYCVNAVAPQMREKGEGAIVNIVDLSAWEPWPDYTAHSVGKSGLLALTRQWALELAPAVRVNAVSPGPVLPPPDYDEERIRRTAEKTLLNRWGRAEDVADAVVFLAQADYITGNVIFVDGGERFGHRKHEAG